MVYADYRESGSHRDPNQSNRRLRPSCDHDGHREANSPRLPSCGFQFREPR